MVVHNLITAGLTIAKHWKFISVDEWLRKYLEILKYSTLTHSIKYRWGYTQKEFFFVTYLWSLFFQ